MHHGEHSIYFASFSPGEDTVEGPERLLEPYNAASKNARINEESDEGLPWIRSF